MPFRQLPDGVPGDSLFTRLSDRFNWGRRLADRVLLLLGVANAAVTVGAVVVAITALIALHNQGERLDQTVHELKGAVAAIQINRVEATTNVCVSQGRTNLVVLELLKLFFPDHDGTAQNQRLRALIQPLLGPIRTPGAVPDPIAAQTACRGHAIQVVRGSGKP